MKAQGGVCARARTNTCKFSVTSRKDKNTCEGEGQGPDDATVWDMLSLVLSSRHYCEGVEPLRGGAYLEVFQPKVVMPLKWHRSWHFLSLWFWLPTRNLLVPCHQPAMPDCLATSSKARGPAPCELKPPQTVSISSPLSLNHLRYCSDTLLNLRAWRGNSLQP